MASHIYGPVMHVRIYSPIEVQTSLTFEADEFFMSIINSCIFAGIDIST
jgi:hypothetical protein